MSQTVTIEEGQAYVFVAVEHELRNHRHSRRAFSQSLRGAGASPAGVYQCFGSIARPAWRVGSTASRSWLQLHVRRFPEQIKCLGIEASPSFVREPGAMASPSASSETLKENLLWVRTFKTIGNCAPSSSRYERLTWLVARHGYKTPDPEGGHAMVIDPTLAATLPWPA